MDSRHTLGILLISAASLAYEITLTRLIAVQQFYHFAFVVISIATMGFAASGALLATRRLKPPPPLLALFFSIAVLAAYFTLNLLPFDSYSIAWDPRQWWILLLYFALSGAPFLAAGWAIGSALDAAGTDAYRPYAANMIGAAIGCPLALIAIDWIGGEGTIGFIIALGLLASVVLSTSRKYALALMTAAAFALLSFSIPVGALQWRLSPYKPLSAAQLASEAKHTVKEWGSTVRLDVIERPGLHSFPGLSLNAALTLPEQAGAFLDGEGPYPITHLSPRDQVAVDLGRRMPSSIAYALRPAAEVLILDWGAGTPALLALAQPGLKLTLPNDQPILTDLLRNSYDRYSYNLLNHPDLDVRPRTARGVLAEKSNSYDVIEFALSDVFHPVTSGAFSLSEDYLLTVNAFADAWSRLNPEGILVITRWIGTPPSDSVRAWNTLLAALRQAGVQDIRKHTIALRGIRTATILVSPRAFTPNEIASVRQFLERNAFDAVLLPDLKPGEINRFNRLPEPIYHQLFDALLNHPAAADEYPFRLTPAVDDKPYFNHFFRWAQTPEVIASLGTFWQPFGGSGYFVLLVLLGLMSVLATVLVLTALFFSARDRPLDRPEFRAMVFFAGLGLGYLLVEIPLIQQFTLLLDHPAQSLAGVLFILLLGSGIGSWLSPRFQIRQALLGLLVYLGVTLLLASPVIHWMLPAPELARWLVMIAMLMPLGILMGMPFASGLRGLERRHPGWIPWAWAVNGAFSGISGVVAAMLALDVGLQGTLAIGWGAYLVANVFGRNDAA
jgi:hypothetical protein